MKKLFIAVFAIAATLMFSVAEAQSRRLGGGRSFGRQSPTVTQQAPMQRQAAPTQQAKPATAAPAPAPAAKPSMWKGLLGGALLGLGLGALLGHMGIGGAAAQMISTILMIGLLIFAVMFIYRMFTRKKEEQQPMAYAGGYPGAYPDSSGSGTYGGGYAGGATPEIGSRLEPQAPAYVPYGVPADFDVAGFLRSAKTYFIRLQDAWDRSDINDIREFTTPEMFAELRMQLQERGNASSYTDVVTLDADLLGIETSGNEQMASVQFWGTLREAPNAPAVEFAEVWNLIRPLSGPGGWVLAGIQNATP